MDTFIPWSVLQRSKSVLDFSQYSYEVGVICIKVGWGE